MARLENNRLFLILIIQKPKKLKWKTAFTKTYQILWLVFLYVFEL